MNIVNALTMNSNRKIKINFSGGNLSSDSGMLLIHEFAEKLGLEAILEKDFSTDDNGKRKHTDSKNAMQKIYQLIAGYFQDDDSDELISDPIFTTILNKKSLASQPTISRFNNRCDEICLYQFELIHQKLRNRIYSWKKPEFLLIDIDSSLFATYGSQEGSSFNAHYHGYGYHPLLAYDGTTGDLLSAKLRSGNCYTSKDTTSFLEPLLDEFSTNYSDIPLFMRGDSGFADVMIYEKLESNGVSYAIRMKENPRLRKAADFIEEELFQKTAYNKTDHAVSYGEFLYKADSWLYPRRVICKIEKPMEQMTHLYTFIVTNMESSPEELINFYYKRGSMENFIRESKYGFNMASMSSKNMIINANKLQINMLAYNLFNWFRRLVLPKSFEKLQADTIRIKLLKIASKLVNSARYMIFKLCSHCPYKKEFFETLDNIFKLKQLR